MKKNINNIDDFKKIKKEDQKVNVISNELLNFTKSELQNIEILKFITYLPELLKPSIEQSIYHKIEEVVFELMKSPEKLDDESMINKLVNITNERVDLDRAVFKSKSEDIKKFISLLMKEYENSLLLSDNSSSKLEIFKNDLQELEISEHSNRELRILHAKLADLIYNLETNLDDSKVQLIKGKETCSKLEKNIAKLQDDLEKLKIEKDIDFLTGALNRRGYTSVILKVENRFVTFNSNYAIIFIDIDDFKEINDVHGHECGDVILKSFSTILKKLMREEDILCRYGGEEFVTLVSYTQEEEVYKYIKRVKEIIDSHKFIYNKDLSVKVGFSAGVSYRTKYNSYEDAMKYADILLYKAKHEGKSRIIFDNSKVLV
ncbi:GGDEF domain-containing protein [Arcobacter sp.]|uniref:GGDEF domain-containing protein n=1 Tax=Arcobacter sp. TaxID=1872629 RepID=UPI003C723783